MSKTVKIWLDRDWHNALAEYYNEHHDQIRKEFQVRNFGHWIGALAFLKVSEFKENDPLGKPRMSEAEKKLEAIKKLWASESSFELYWIPRPLIEEIMESSEFKENKE